MRIGSVCKCRHGYLGIITDNPIANQRNPLNGPLYKGVQLNGKPWQSKHPTKVAETVADFIVDCKMDSELMEQVIGTIACDNSQDAG